MVLVAALKSSFIVQSLLNLSSCDLSKPAKVCFGWWLDLNKRACVSVSLKNTLMSNRDFWVKVGPLKVVVSKKSTELKSNGCSVVKGGQKFIKFIYLVVPDPPYVVQVSKIV